MTTRTCHARSWMSKTQWIKVCVLILPKIENENKRSRQVGVLSSNLISWPDLERPAPKYPNCWHGMVWLVPHQAGYLAGCYVCTKRNRLHYQGYRQNIQPQCVSKSGRKYMFIASHVAILSFRLIFIQRYGNTRTLWHYKILTSNIWIWINLAANTSPTNEDPWRTLLISTTYPPSGSSEKTQQCWKPGWCAPWAAMGHGGKGKDPLITKIGKQQIPNTASEFWKQIKVGWRPKLHTTHERNRLDWACQPNLGTKEDSPPKIVDLDLEPCIPVDVSG